MKYRFDYRSTIKAIHGLNARALSSSYVSRGGERNLHATAGFVGGRHVGVPARLVELAGLAGHWARRAATGGWKRQIQCSRIPKITCVTKLSRERGVICSWQSSNLNDDRSDLVFYRGEKKQGFNRSYTFPGPVSRRRENKFRRREFSNFAYIIPHDKMSLMWFPSAPRRI